MWYNRSDDEKELLYHPHQYYIIKGGGKQVENIRIRKAAKRHGIALWELARYFSISEATVSRRLRVPLDPVEEEKWLHAIDELAAIDPEERPAHLFGMG